MHMPERCILDTKWFFYLLALTVLMCGIFYYYLFRPPVLVSEWIGLADAHDTPSFRRYLDWFPSFVHVFSFSLLTWLALEKRYAFFSVMLWVGINLFFEIAQMLPSAYAKNLPGILYVYVLRGTFSISDILAVCMAGGFSYLVMRIK